MINPIFVALDTTQTGKAAVLAAKLEGLVGGFKLGLEFFTAQGPAGIEAVGHLGMPLFLDLKFHDIPNTVAGAMRGIARLRPAMTTLHAQGGIEMMRAGIDAARDEAAKLGISPPKVLAVTVLTSLDEAALAAMGVNGPVLDHVLRLAERAAEAGVDGLVCSSHEVAAVRKAVGPDKLLVVPGIRPAWGDFGDQKRVMTPREAYDLGADILVIGRPITSAADPAAAARDIAGEVAQCRSK